MPTILGKPYSIDWVGEPPHMLKPDVPVWYRFLTVYGHLFRNLYYDVLLGAISLTPQEEKDPLKTMWRYNLARRADAIAETRNAVWIIEVASDPSLRAIGQLLTYRVLWIRDTPILKPENLVLVAATLEPNLMDAASSYGIQIYII